MVVHIIRSQGVFSVENCNSAACRGRARIEIIFSLLSNYFTYFISGLSTWRHFSVKLIVITFFKDTFIHSMHIIFQHFLNLKSMRISIPMLFKAYILKLKISFDRVLVSTFQTHLVSNSFTA